MVKSQKLSNLREYNWYYEYVGEKKKVPEGLTAWKVKNGSCEMHLGELVCRVPLAGGTKICGTPFQGTNTLRAHVNKAHDNVDLDAKKGQGSAEDLVSAKEYFIAVHKMHFMKTAKKFSESLADSASPDVSVEYDEPKATPKKKATGTKGTKVTPKPKPKPKPSTAPLRPPGSSAAKDAASGSKQASAEGADVRRSERLK